MHEAADLLRGEVLHASGDLVGAGHQVFEGELLVGDFTGVEGVVHAGRPTCPQVLPQVAFGCVLHQDVQRTCVQHRAQSHFQNTVNHRDNRLDNPRGAAASPSCVLAPSRWPMFSCFPIIFIISISDTRSDRSLSVASSGTNTRERRHN